VHDFVLPRAGLYTSFKIIRQAFKQDGLDQAIHYAEETVRACRVNCMHASM
jgi:hypothetical protein